MSNIIYTATGCNRCKIAKKFMDEHGIGYEDLDIKADGKDAFGQFYRNHRSHVYRGKEGIEFPVFTDGTAIRQGVGVVIAYLQAGTRLDGFIGRSERSHGWMDGIHVSGGDPSLVDELIIVLEFIKKNGLSLQIDTWGKNASVLEQLLALGLGDRVVMELHPPAVPRDGTAAGEGEPAEFRKTIELVTRFPEYRFQTTLAPVLPREGEAEGVRYPTPGDIEATARLLLEVTGSNGQPYVLRCLDPAGCPDERLKSMETLPPEALFRCRSAARKHQVRTEIEKT